MIIEDQSQNEHPLDEESNIEQEESIWTIGRKSNDHRKTNEKFKLPVLPLYIYKGLILTILFFIALIIIGFWNLLSLDWSNPLLIASWYVILYGVLLLYRPIERSIWPQTHQPKLKNIDHLYNLLILTSMPVLILVLGFIILFGLYGWGDITALSKFDDDFLVLIGLNVFLFIPMLVTWWAQKYRWRKRNKLSKNHQL